MVIDKEPERRLEPDRWRVPGGIGLRSPDVLQQLHCRKILMRTAMQFRPIKDPAAEFRSDKKTM